MKTLFQFCLSAVISVCLWNSTTAVAQQQSNAIRFTSVPDIFNWNISNPQPGWEDTLDWFFDRLKNEGPDFTLVAGDIMDARWWENAEQVRRKTEQYWGGFIKRFKDRDMTVYVAPGDHEYGDDGGLARGDIARAFGKEFSRQMGMPDNGPTGHVGRSFFIRQGNLLVITLDTFEDAGKRFAYTVGEEQLRWMDQVLTDHHDAQFVIVQGHLPVVGPVKSKNSSASMLRDGTDSGLWKLMVRHNVDAYLCGEHHRITVKKQDGIWQIVHGALWGTQTDLNYMRGNVHDDKLTLELIEFDVEYSGGYIGDHPHRGTRNRPRERVKRTEETKAQGPRVSGTLVIHATADGKNEDAKVTGWFEQAVETK
jgi:DNA repair exonuclease SbcCD nuclease subunit